MSDVCFSEADLAERAAKVLGRPRLTFSSARGGPYLGPSPFARQLMALGASTATAAILSAHGIVQIDSLYGRDRHATVSLARHELMAWLKRNIPLASFPEIGRLFGRDHTTILSAREKIRELAEVDPEVRLRQEIPRDPLTE